MLCAVSVWLMVWWRWFDDSISLNGSMSLVWLLQQFIMCLFLSVTFSRPFRRRAGCSLLIASVDSDERFERKERAGLKWGFAHAPWYGVKLRQLKHKSLDFTFILWSFCEALSLTEFTSGWVWFSNGLRSVQLCPIAVKDVFQLDMHECKQYNLYFLDQSRRVGF